LTRLRVMCLPLAAGGAPGSVDLARGMLRGGYVKSVPFWQKHRSLPHGSTT
jgi:hypothetical protein